MQPPAPRGRTSPEGSAPYAPLPQATHKVTDPLCSPLRVRGRAGSPILPAAAPVEAEPTGKRVTQPMKHGGEFHSSKSLAKTRRWRQPRIIRAREIHDFMQGLQSSISQKSSTIGSIFGGVIIDSWGYTGAFLTAMSCTAIALFIVWFRVPDPRKVRETRALRNVNITK